MQQSDIHNNLNDNIFPENPQDLANDVLSAAEHLLRRVGRPQDEDEKNYEEIVVVLSSENLQAFQESINFFNDQSDFLEENWLEQFEAHAKKLCNICRLPNVINGFQWVTRIFNKRQEVAIITLENADESKSICIKDPLPFTKNLYTLTAAIRIARAKALRMNYFKKLQAYQAQISSNEEDPNQQNIELELYPTANIMRADADIPSPVEGGNNSCKLLLDRAKPKIAAMDRQCQEAYRRILNPTVEVKHIDPERNLNTETQVDSNDASLIDNNTTELLDGLIKKGKKLTNRYKVIILIASLALVIGAIYCYLNPDVLTFTTFDPLTAVTITAGLFLFGICLIFSRRLYQINRQSKQWRNYINQQNATLPTTLSQQQHTPSITYQPFNDEQLPRSLTQDNDNMTEGNATMPNCAIMSRSWLSNYT